MCLTGRESRPNLYPMSQIPHTCQRCDGSGRITIYLRQARSTPWRFARGHSCLVSHIVRCDSCENGQVTELTRGRYLCGIGGPAWDRWLAAHSALASQLGVDIPSHLVS